MPVPELEDLRAHAGVFEQISAVYPISGRLPGGDRARRIEMLGTTPN